MAFSDEVNKVRSKRAVFIKLQPTIKTPEVDWTEDTGVNWYMDYDKPVTGMVVNNVVQVLGTLPLSNGEFFYDYNAKRIYNKGIGFDNGDDNIYMTIDLNLTSGPPVDLNNDPLNSGTPVVEWYSRIQENINIGSSIRNIISGVVTISSSVVSIVNPDSWIQNIIDKDTNIAGKLATVWFDVNDVKLKMATLRMQGITFTNSNVNIGLLEGSADLRAAALLGDGDNEAYIKRNSPSYVPRVEDEGLPIPFIFNRSNGTVGNNKVIEPRSKYSLIAGKMNKATCIDYGDVANNTTNREWVLCRAEDFKTNTITGASQVRVFNASPLTDIAYPFNTANTFAAGSVTCTSHNLEVGEQFRYNYTGSYRACVVTNITSTTILFFMPGILPPGSVSNDNSPDIQNIICPGLLLKQDTKYFIPRYSDDFTVTVTSTSGGNKLMKITLVDDFEASSAHKDGLTKVIVDVSPDNTDLLYKVVDINVGSETTEGEAAKYILDKSGLTTTSSFNASEVNSANVMFSIPQAKQKVIGSILEYLQSLIGPVNHILRMNNIGAFELYELGSTSTTHRGIRDENNILKDSFKSSIVYEDVYTEIVYSSDYESQKDPTDISKVRNVVIRDDNNNARGTQKVLPIKHLLEDLPAGLLDSAIANSVDNRIEYTFTTSTADLETLVGDKLTLTYRGVLNKTKSVECTVIKLDKSINNTKITVAYGGGF